MKPSSTSYFTRIILTLALTGALVLHAAAAETKKLLVITQSKGFRHDPVKRGTNGELCLVEKTMAKIGKDSGLFETVNSQNAIEALTRENLKKFDAVLFYTTGILLPEGDPREALMDFVKQGKAFIGIHSATDTFHGGKDAFNGYVQMINGSFNGHPWNAGLTSAFVKLDTDHPVAKMFPAEFNWKDEIYQYNNFDASAVRVIYSLDMSKSSLKMPYLVPVCWVREFGQGRLFYTNLGHNEATWKNETFQQHLIAGFRWATKLDDGTATPNPDAQKAEHNKSVVAYAAAETKKEFAQLMAKAGNAKWLEGVSAAADAYRKAPSPDSKKAKPEEVEAAKAKRAELKEKLSAALEQ